MSTWFENLILIARRFPREAPCWKSEIAHPLSSNRFRNAEVRGMRVAGRRVYAITEPVPSVVAWADSSMGNPEIYLKRWNGTAWVEYGSNSASLGGISYACGASFRPSIGLGGGFLAVAWED